MGPVPPSSRQLWLSLPATITVPCVLPTYYQGPAVPIVSNPPINPPNHNAPFSTITLILALWSPLKPAPGSRHCSVSVKWGSCHPSGPPATSPSMSFPKSLSGLAAG